MTAADLERAARLGEPAWRQGRRSRPRVLLLVGVIALAAFLAAILLVGRGERAEREIPLLVADGTPFRVRPADPGGLVVPHQDQLVYQRMAGTGPPSGRRIEVLLPPPEEPLPRPAPPPAPAPQPPPPAAELPPAASPPPAEAAAGAAAGMPVPPPKPAAPPLAPLRAAGVQVQLAAVATEAAVEPEWNRLRARLPDLLADRTLIASRGERDGQPFWRLRTGGFADLAAARAFCEQVRARGFTCFVVGGS